MRRPGITWRVALALPIAALAAYWPALRGTLVWDDDAHVTRPDLQSLHGLARIWTEPGATQQYYPILHSAFWVEHRLWGDSTLGYHLLNVALHAAVCLLFFYILRRLSVPGAVLATFAFALHPVCAESVAWISEQKNTLSGVFYMAAALAYLRFDAERRGRWYALATGLFALALLTKSVTATLPAALLVVLWWKRGRLSARADVLPLAPWLALGAAVGLFTAWVERTFIGASGAAFDLTLAGRFVVAGRAAWFYLGKVLWPAGLVSIYPRWAIHGDSLRQWRFPVAAGAALLVLVLFMFRRRSRGPLAAALLFVGTLLPALGFINVYPFVFSYVADHFQYLAAAGLIAALSAGLTLLAGRLAPGGRMGTGALATGLVAFLGCLTWAQAGKYRDPESFYGAIIERNPSSWLAHDNLGILLAREGRTNDAASHYREAIRLNPAYPEAFNNYGNLLARSGRIQEAEEVYAGALRARPSFAVAEYDWGYALSEAGRYPDSVGHYRNAIRLNPGYAEAHYALANAMANTGRLAEAVAEYREALELVPGYPEANANLGLALAEEGKWDEAIADISEAVRARPGYAEAHAYLGYVLARAGRLPDAVAEDEEAIRLSPGNPDIRFQAAEALGSLGREAEAREQIDEGRRLQAARGH
jgi:tetratricopeptide (TPR) repeat protein